MPTSDKPKTKMTELADKLTELVMAKMTGPKTKMTELEAKLIELVVASMTEREAEMAEIEAKRTKPLRPRKRG